MIEDLRRLMRVTEGAQKLDLDRFADLMLKIEVQSLTALLYYLQVGTLKLLWGLVCLGLPDVAI